MCGCGTAMQLLPLTVTVDSRIIPVRTWITPGLSTTSHRGSSLGVASRPPVSRIAGSKSAAAPTSSASGNVGRRSPAILQSASALLTTDSYGI